MDHLHLHTVLFLTKLVIYTFKKITPHFKTVCGFEVRKLCIMDKQQIKDKIIINGVQNLKEFGYKNVNTENILTDEVYSIMFLKMLEDNLGSSKLVDKVINELITSINKIKL
jgi:hypothetical protein